MKWIWDKLRMCFKGGDAVMTRPSIEYDKKYMNEKRKQKKKKPVNKGRMDSGAYEIKPNTLCLDPDKTFASW